MTYRFGMEAAMEERDKIIIGALKECSSRASIEDTFTRFQIENRKDRTDKLNLCMGDPETFFSSSNVSVDEIYELTIQMFLTGSWKLQEYYKRMGIAADGRLSNNQ